MEQKRSMPGVSRFWERAVGVARANQRVTRSTGISFTGSGRQRKQGKMLSCSLSLLVIMATLSTLIYGCGGEDRVYINAGERVFHYPNCSLRQTKADGYSIESALKVGYEECPKCAPSSLPQARPSHKLGTVPEAIPRTAPPPPEHLPKNSIQTPSQQEQQPTSAIRQPAPNSVTYRPASPAQQQTANQDMVYIGATGTKYHKATCRTLKGNGRAVSMQQAQSQGREACRVCGG